MKRNPETVALNVLLVVLLLAIAISFIVNVCSVDTEAATKCERFTTEYEGNFCYIITDNDTGVQYLAVEFGTAYGKGVGLTRLEDK